VSLAQYSVSRGGNRSFCWGDHENPVASCSLLPDTPSASMSAVSRIIGHFLILLMSMLEGTCLNVLVLPGSLSYLWQTSLSRASQPTAGRGIALTSYLSCLVLWELLPGFTLWGSSTTSTLSNHFLYPLSSVSSPNLKNHGLPLEKDNNKTQTKRKI